MTAATPGRSSAKRLATRRDVAPSPVGDAAERAQKLLKQRPAAEIVDDELVFDERTVLERLSRLRLAKPAIGEKAAGNRAVAEQADAMARHRSARPFSGRRSRTEYCTCIDDERNAGRDDGAHVRRVEIGAADQPHLALARSSSSQPSASSQRGSA